MKATKDLVGSEDGFSLIAVLWIVIAIAAIMTPITITAKTHSQHTASMHHVDRLNLMAGGIAVALRAKLGSAAGRIELFESLSSSSVHGCKSGKVEVAYSVVPHSGLVNLNLASEDILGIAFEALGTDKIQATDLARQVSAFRSHSVVEMQDNADAIAGGTKHARFESVSELYDIPGLRNVSYRNLQNTFTTNTGSGSPNPARSNDILKRALQKARGVSGRGVSETHGHEVAVTVSVALRIGSFTGQSNAIYSASNIAGRFDQTKETWRYDEPFNHPEVSNLMDCSAVLGVELARILESMG